MKPLLAAISTILPATVHAAAPLADLFSSHRHWMFPAYAYCLLFGLTILITLSIISAIRRTQIRNITSRISLYLNRRPLPAIIVAGFLLCIPLGIIGAVMWEFFWILSAIPSLVVFAMLPVTLTNRRIREKCILSSSALKWLLIISASAVGASLLFIILTLCHFLPYTDIPFYCIHNNEFQFNTHPFHSMKTIWGEPLILCATIPIGLLFYCLGYLKQLFNHKL